MGQVSAVTNNDLAAGGETNSDGTEDDKRDEERWQEELDNEAMLTKEAEVHLNALFGDSPEERRMRILLERENGRAAARAPAKKAQSRVHKEVTENSS